MGDVVPLHPTVLRCSRCEAPLRREEDGNYRCPDCGHGSITSPTGVRVTRRDGCTVIEPDDREP